MACGLAPAQAKDNRQGTNAVPGFRNDALRVEVANAATRIANACHAATCHANAHTPTPPPAIAGRA